MPLLGAIDDPVAIAIGLEARFLLRSVVGLLVHLPVDVTVITGALSPDIVMTIVAIIHLIAMEKLVLLDRAAILIMKLRVTLPHKMFDFPIVALHSNILQVHQSRLTTSWTQLSNLLRPSSSSLVTPKMVLVCA